MISDRHLAWQKKIIVICYASGGGGKFLANALSLCSPVALQAARFISLTAQQNFDYLMSAIEKSIQDNDWRDLELGESHFINRDSYFLRAVALKKHIAHTCHSATNYTDLYKLFPHASYIEFTNTADFVSVVRPNKMHRMRNAPVVTHTTPIYFDASALLNRELAIIEVRRVHQLLGYSEFNESLVGQFYDAWWHAINTIDYIFGKPAR